MNLLKRPGALVQDVGQTYPAEPDADGDGALMLLLLQSEAITDRTAFGRRAWQKMLTLRGVALRETVASDQGCGASAGVT
jgi:hypothetical protein